MKKLFAVLLSLLFIVSVFGVATFLGFICDATAIPEKVKVGEIITITSDINPCVSNGDLTCYDPTIKIYDPSIEAVPGYPLIENSEFEKFQDASGHATKLSGPIKTGEEPDEIWTWTYRANQAGTIVFGAPAFPRSPPQDRLITNPVTITNNSYPMLQFMKIFGFGKKD